MSKPRSLLRLLGVMVLAIAVGITFAGPASAKQSKAQKRASKVLIKQLKKNPRLIKSKRWLRKAAHVQATLPLTVRLNPIINKSATPGDTTEAASDDTANIDLTSTFGPNVGNKVTKLSGKLDVLATFGNPAEGDDLGDLRLSVTSASLSASSVAVLDTPGTGAACAADNGGAGAAARPDNTLTTGGLGDRSTLGNFVSAASQAPSVTPDTTVRTAPISINLASVAGSPAIGKANIFSDTNNVRLSLHAAAKVNTIFRSTETGMGFAAGQLPGAAFFCDEAYAGQTDSSGLGTPPGSPTTGGDIGPVGHRNIIPVNVTGNLKINPAITTDGKLRLATVTVQSTRPEESTIDACLQINSLIRTADSSAASNTLLGSPSGFALLTRNATPTTACDSAYTPYNPATATGTEPWPLAAVIDAGGDTLADEITPASAKFLQLDPNVEVTGLSAEALVGTGASY
ncbi:MAG TPA: hypothetical protein VF752_06450 [Thermoleophilaceae bacterium]